MNNDYKNLKTNQKAEVQHRKNNKKNKVYNPKEPWALGPRPK